MSNSGAWAQARPDLSGTSSQKYQTELEGLIQSRLKNGQSLFDGFKPSLPLPDVPSVRPGTEAFADLQKLNGSKSLAELQQQLEASKTALAREKEALATLQRVRLYSMASLVAPRPSKSQEPPALQEKEAGLARVEREKKATVAQLEQTEKEAAAARARLEEERRTAQQAAQVFVRFVHAPRN